MTDPEPTCGVEPPPLGRRNAIGRRPYRPETVKALISRRRPNATIYIRLKDQSAIGDTWWLHSPISKPGPRQLPRRSRRALSPARAGTACLTAVERIDGASGPTHALAEEYRPTTDPIIRLGDSYHQCLPRILCVVVFKSLDINSELSWPGRRIEEAMEAYQGLWLICAGVEDIPCFKQNLQDECIVRSYLTRSYYRSLLIWETFHAYTFFDACWKPVQWADGLIICCHVCIQPIRAREGLLPGQFRGDVGLCDIDQISFRPRNGGKICTPATLSQSSPSKEDTLDLNGCYATCCKCSNKPLWLQLRYRDFTG